MIVSVVEYSEISAGDTYCLPTSTFITSSGVL